MPMRSDTMRAAVLERFGEPLELREIARPTPREGEVLVRVRAVGLCGTDLKVVDGVLPGLRLPLIPGHEIAGEIVAGDGELLGARVACYLYEPCGRCRWCRSSDHALCPDAARIGRSRDGGLAEYVVLRKENVFPFTAVSFAAAAVAMDAVATPWRALRVRGGLRAGERVAISGAGGLGLNAVQVAVNAGASVAVFDPDATAREKALALGAEVALTPERARDAVDWSSGGVDLGLEASGRRAGFEALVACTRPGGRVVCCGYAPGSTWEMDSMCLVLSELAVIGSRAGSREDARNALAAVEAGDIVPAIASTLPLEDVNDAFSRLRHGGLAGRLMIEIP
jgi:D-arabinose 1-dehydrogenase-like Zn-dependent alcohol dehydrogenase